MNLFWIQLNRIPSSVRGVIHQYTLIPFICNQLVTTVDSLEKHIEHFEEFYIRGTTDMLKESHSTGNDTSIHTSILDTILPMIQSAGFEAMDVAIFGLLVVMGVLVLLHSKRRRRVENIDIDVVEQ